MLKWDAWRRPTAQKPPTPAQKVTLCSTSSHAIKTLEIPYVKTRCVTKFQPSLITPIFHPATLRSPTLPDNYTLPFQSPIWIANMSISIPKKNGKGIAIFSNSDFSFFLLFITGLKSIVHHSRLNHYPFVVFFLPILLISKISCSFSFWKVIGIVFFHFLNSSPDQR